MECAPHVHHKSHELQDLQASCFLVSCKRFKTLPDYFTTSREFEPKLAVVFKVFVALGTTVSGEALVVPLELLCEDVMSTLGVLSCHLFLRFGRFGVILTMILIIWLRAPFRLILITLLPFNRSLSTFANNLFCS